MKLKTTNYCMPYDYDERGNVIKCQSYESESKNIIKNSVQNIINFIKRNE
jgi:hypothetical protein